MARRADYLNDNKETAYAMIKCAYGQKNKQYGDLTLPPGTQKTLTVAKRAYDSSKYCKVINKVYTG